LVAFPGKSHAIREGGDLANFEDHSMRDFVSTFRESSGVGFDVEECPLDALGRRLNEVSLCGSFRSVHTISENAPLAVFAESNIVVERAYESAIKAC
jgi:hypothetical protein